MRQAQSGRPGARGAPSLVAPHGTKPAARQQRLMEERYGTGGKRRGGRRTPTKPAASRGGPSVTPKIHVSPICSVGAVSILPCSPCGRWYLTGPVAQWIARGFPISDKSKVAGSIPARVGFVSMMLLTPCPPPPHTHTQFHHRHIEER